MRKKVSIVIPVYNEEKNIDPLIRKVLEVQEKKYYYEIIMVDDGSTDGTLEHIKKNKQIQYISFSRNFGHQVALKAGLDYSSGDCVISMDGDLQHPPKYIPIMIKKWLEGYDVVYMIRNDSNPSIKKFTSNLFYRLINSISDINIPPGGADFRLLDKKVVGVVRSINDSSIFLRGLIPWAGFKESFISYDVGTRFSGKTKYSFKRMLFLALDGITSFSVKPLHVATFIGFFCAFISSLYGIYAIAVRLFFSQAISGWASLVTTVVFMGGIQLLILGIIGEYLGKLFIASKNRPDYKKE